MLITVCFIIKVSWSVSLVLERLVRESIVRAVSCYSACYPVSVFMCIWLVAAALPLQAPEVQLVEFK